MNVNWILENLKDALYLAVEMVRSCAIFEEKSGMWWA